MDTVKVKLLTHTIYDLEVKEPGDVLEVSKAFGLGLVHTKQAELVKVDKKQVGEEVNLKNTETTEVENKEQVQVVTKRKGK